MAKNMETVRKEIEYVKSLGLADLVEWVNTNLFNGKRHIFHTNSDKDWKALAEEIGYARLVSLIEDASKWEGFDSNDEFALYDPNNCYITSFWNRQDVWDLFGSAIEDEIICRED